MVVLVGRTRGSENRSTRWVVSGYLRPVQASSFLQLRLARECMITPFPAIYALSLLNPVLRRSHKADKRCQDRGPERNRRIQTAKGGRIQEVRGWGQIYLLHAATLAYKSFYSSIYGYAKGWHPHSWSQHSSGYKKAEEDANKEAEAKLQEIKSVGDSKGESVVDGLIQAVINVKPEVPEKIVASA